MSPSLSTQNSPTRDQDYITQKTQNNIGRTVEMRKRSERLDFCTKPSDIGGL